MPIRQPFIEPGAVVADYQVEHLIARGGMGEVYLARDTRLDRWVALKVLPADLSEDEKFRSRFIRESKLAASVDHPNIIPIYGAGDVDGQLFLAMRYVRGSDLRQELAANGPMDVGTTLSLLTDVAAALDAAHSAGLIHRDVKPANILLADDVLHGQRGHVYLSDFGLTRRSTSASGLTTAGHFMGTLDYVAPEQIKGGLVDGRADVYALACVAYEMLVGDPPFHREDDTALLWAHVFEDPPRISDLLPTVPPALEDALTSGLAKAPDERPSTCGDLVRLMRGPGSSAEPQQATEAQSAPDGVRSPRTPGPQLEDVARGTDIATDEAGRGRGRLRTVSPRIGRRRRRTLLVTLGLGAAVVMLGALVGLDRITGAGRDQFSAADVPYTLEVPSSWTPRRNEAGDSTTTVLSEPDLRALFNDEQAALERAAGDIESDPASMVGLTIYHRPFPAGLSRADRVTTTEALLPGEARLVDRGMAPTGEATSQVMDGTISLPDETSLQTRVLALRTEPEQLLVFFAPPSHFTEESETFDEVADSLRMTE
jgi:hypothetical protein